MRGVQTWKVLRALADGSSLMTSEIAERCGLPNHSVSDRSRAGIVIAPRDKLYEIAAQFLADRIDCLRDFGNCPLRLGTVF